MRPRTSRQRLTQASVFACLLLLSSCIVTPMTLKASTRPLPSDYVVTGPTEASAWSFFALVLGFIPIGYGPKDPAGDARDLAIAKADGDALIDVTGDVRTWILPIPFVPIFVYQTEVQGEAVQFHE